MRSPANLPPIGPAWFPAVMGIGIFATLVQLATEHVNPAQITSAQLTSGQTTCDPASMCDSVGAALSALAMGALATAWAVLVFLLVGFCARVAWQPRTLVKSWTHPTQLPLWGTVSMGVLALGSATGTVVPVAWPELARSAWAVSGGMWTLGTSLGLATTFAFIRMLWRHDCGTPTTIWGLAVVGPMVSATTGAALIARVPTELRLSLLVASLGCFFVSLICGAAIFGAAYYHYWRVAPVPLAASCSTWIPLGMIGQSTAAAQGITANASGLVWFETSSWLGPLAEAYGIVALLLGVPLMGYATWITGRGFAHKMPFTPGWWAMTFPVGTLALGAHTLGDSLNATELHHLGLALTAVLGGTVTVCLAQSVAHLGRTVVARVLLAGRATSTA